MAATHKRKELFSAKEFAEKAVWLPDGQITYDFTFTEKDVNKVAAEQQYDDDKENTFSAALCGFLETPEQRREHDAHFFVDDFFGREVEEGWAMDSRLDDETIAPQYTLLRFVDGKCSMRATINIVLVEHWVFNVSRAYYSAAIRNGQNLSQRKRAALAELYAAYMCAIENAEYLDYCSGDLVDYKRDHDLEMVMQDLRLPYVPTAWYKTRLIAADKRRAEKEAEKLAQHEKAVAAAKAKSIVVTN